MSNSNANIRRIVGVIGNNDQVSELVSTEGYPSLLESSGTRLVRSLESSLQVAESNRNPTKEPTSEVVKVKPTWEVGSFTSAKR
jgi:hypothetical protein